jgi:hypothetical protein
MHDITTPLPYISKASYADDITITSTYTNANMTSIQVQKYRNILQTWFTTNRLQIAPTKSTATLLTNYTKEHQYVPHVTLNNTLTHKHNTKILGVKYNTFISFRDHIQDIN